MEPGSPEWQKLITASKVAAILGVSPWESQRSIWHKMHGDILEPPATAAQSRGHYLEPAILAWWSDQHPEFWESGDYTSSHQQSFTLGDWAAATPDMSVHPLAPKVEGKLGRKILPPSALVEAKSVSSLDDWGDEGTDVIPAYYLTQVYWQMHVSGATRCYVPIIGPRLVFAEYVVDYDPEYGEALEARMRAFYDSLAADQPPPLDDTVATYNAVRKVHKDIEPGAEIELTAKEARDVVLWADELKHTEASARLAKSTVIDRMGRAQYATHQGVRIARRQPRGEDVTFVVVAKPEHLTTDGDEAA